ncbi:MAG TPA: hypothetical protein DCZ95_19660 [Verrucomicrobia bacterium]|nr:MAG: hypothetical protein A2X46_10885 [Lentisphaerae bacterium GWF2_57_35]HBA86303.1 hypothetical protein [Verrucomicrobiota bacterium]
MATEQKSNLGFWNRFFRGPGVILLVPWAIVVLFGLLVYSLIMTLLVRAVCLFRGRYIVFVHSNSPVWLDFIANDILPHLPADTVILNWSDRLKWKWFSFPVRLFKLYGGDTNFNPMGLVCTTFRGVKTFRFWDAFKECKHGNEKPLEELKTNFFAYIERTK